MPLELLNIIMSDGSRHFGELPSSISWYALRDHLRKLKGAVITQFLTDDITEAWIDFTYRGSEFAVNNKFGSYWFFVRDPNCSDEDLIAVLSHCQVALKQLTIVGDASKARLIAVFIDHLIAFALTMLVVAFVPETLPLMKAVLVFAVYLSYFIVLEALFSRTLGKLFQGLVVRKLNGTPCDWKAALIRGALRIIEVNPLLLGGFPAGLVIIASQQKQRVGDVLAGTVVISSKFNWDDNSVKAGAEEALEGESP